MSFVCMRWTSSSRVAWLSACSTSTAVTSKPFFNICPYQIKTTTLAWKQHFLCVPMEHAWREIMRPMFSQDFSSTICGFAGSGRLQQHSVSILNKSSRKQTQGKENNLQGLEPRDRNSRGRIVVWKRWMDLNGYKLVFDQGGGHGNLGIDCRKQRGEHEVP